MDLRLLGLVANTEVPSNNYFFKPPQSPSSWKGVRSSQRPPICIQPSGTNKTKGQEDCLYLNVYTPHVRFEIIPLNFMFIIFLVSIICTTRENWFELGIMNHELKNQFLIGITNHSFSKWCDSWITNHNSNHIKLK